MVIGFPREGGRDTGRQKLKIRRARPKKSVIILSSTLAHWFEFEKDLENKLYKKDK